MTEAENFMRVGLALAVGLLPELERCGRGRTETAGARIREHHRGRFLCHGDHRIKTTGTLQLRTISVVVDPITRLRMRLWP